MRAKSGRESTRTAAPLSPGPDRTERRRERTSSTTRPSTRGPGRCSHRTGSGPRRPRDRGRRGRGGGEHPALDVPGREAAPAEGVVPHRVVRPGPQAEELGEGHGGPAPERLAVGRAADALHGTVADHGEAELAVC